MRVSKHFLASILAFTLVFGTLFIFKNRIFSVSKNAMSSSKNLELKKSLNRGDIVVLGTSELEYFYQRFIPHNFFNNELNVSLTANGEAGNSSMIHMAQLMGNYGDEM